MPGLPTGTVTFLFTDIEGSTELLRQLGDDYVRAQDTHAALIRAAIERFGGTEVRTVGDAFFVAFGSAIDAVAAAVDAQRRLGAHPWDEGAEIRVRMGLHTGEGSLGGDDYVGIDVNRAARVSATGHGGQVVLSEATRSLVEGALPIGAEIRSLGSHRLKDFDDPTPLHDLVIDGLTVEFPPLRSLDAPRTNLRAPRTALVGREGEIADALDALDGARLLTLTGPGGIGKTRLALEVARRRLDRGGDDEVYVVDLSDVGDASLIASEIASVLRIRDQPGLEPTRLVASALRDRSMLLVLDNLEQLLDGVDTIAVLLDEAPGLRVLATSRIPLRLGGERELAVGPLRLPDEPGRVEELADSDAVRLFLDRATAVRPDLVLDASNGEAIGRIVASLDGLPLALELAASQLRVLDAPGLADRLERHLPLPAAGPRDAPERQRTLDAAIAWSYEALSDGERATFERLAIFAGGFTLPAAEAVIADGADLLGGLTALIDQSLVRRIEGAGGPRYALFETIRGFAADRFEGAGHDRHGLDRRHAAWYRELAETAEPHLTGDQQLSWLATIADEHANLRAAFARAEAADDPVLTQDALRAAAAIWRFWHARSHLPEGRATLERLLSLPSAREPTRERALALGALGSVEYWLLDYEPMRVHYAEQVAIARTIGDPRLLAAALFNVSFEHVPTGDLVSHLAAVEAALEAADPDDHLLLAQIWMGIGFNRVLRGEAPLAIEPIDRSIELYRRCDDLSLLCEALTTRAAVAYLQGDLAGAVPWLQETIEIAAATPTPQVLSRVLYPQALLDNALERFDRSATLLGAQARIEATHDLHFPETGVAFFGDPAEPARAALGDAAFGDAFEVGRSMSDDELVAFLTAEG